MKKIKKITITLSALLTMACMPVANASATYYYDGLYRGLNGITYCQTDFFWEVDSRYCIKSSSASQWVSGIAMEAGGTTLCYSSPLEHDWQTVCSNTFGIGKFSWKKTYTNMVALSNSGSSWIIW